MTDDGDGPRTDENSFCVFNNEQVIFEFSLLLKTNFRLYRCPKITLNEAGGPTPEL